MPWSVCLFKCHHNVDPSPAAAVQRRGRFHISDITRVDGLCPEAFGRMAEWQNTSARLYMAWQKA